MSIPPDHHLVAGDVISVSAVLEHSSDPADRFVHARVGGPYGLQISVERSEATLSRTHLSVGDRVRHDVPEDFGPLGSVGTIVAIADDRAWVSWKCGRQDVLVLSRLRRICTPDASETAPQAFGA